MKFSSRISGKYFSRKIASLTNSEAHYKIAGKNAAVITMEASTKLHDSEVKKGTSTLGFLKIFLQDNWVTFCRKLLISTSDNICGKNCTPRWVLLMKIQSFSHKNTLIHNFEEERSHCGQ